jgi:hypothetical protein
MDAGKKIVAKIVRDVINNKKRKGGNGNGNEVIIN